MGAEDCTVPSTDTNCFIHEDCHLYSRGSSNYYNSVQMRSCTSAVGVKKWAVKDSYRFLKHFVKASNLHTSKLIKVRHKGYHCDEKKVVVKGTT